MQSLVEKRIRAVRRARRARRVLAASGLTRPRLSVFRSNRRIAVQLIDDRDGRTLASASDREFLSQGGKKASVAPRRERATWVGTEIAARAKALGVIEIRFDRGRYQFHGLVRAVAEGARAGGLRF